MSSKGEMNTEQMEAIAPASDDMVTDELLQQSNKALSALVKTQTLLRQEIRNLSDRDDNELANVIIAVNQFMENVNTSITGATLIAILFTQSRAINRQKFAMLHSRCEKLILENETLKAEIKACKESKKNPVMRWAEKVLGKLFH